MNTVSNELNSFINKHTSILLIPGQVSKIDTLAASGALALVIEKLGKEVSIYFGSPIPQQLEFLGLGKFFLPNRWDSVIFVGDADPKHIFFVKRHLSDTHILNVGRDNISSSISESLTRTLKEFNEEHLTEDAATALLTGIISSTKNFQSPNIKPQTLFTSAYLIAKKARNELVVRHLYTMKSLELVKLWGSVIANFSWLPDKKIGWSFVTEADLKNSNAQKYHIAQLINELKSNFAQAEVFVLGLENSPGAKTAVLHAVNPVRLNNFASAFGITLKNSSCIIKLNPSLDIKTGTEKFIEEFSPQI